MVTTCCVLNCRNEAYPGCGIGFFRFPKNDDLRRRWLNVIPTKSIVTKNSTVCSRHFKSEEVYHHLWKSTLKPDAIPSIFPKPPVPDKRIINFLNSIQGKNLKPEPSTSEYREHEENDEQDPLKLDPEPDLELKPDLEPDLEPEPELEPDLESEPDLEPEPNLKPEPKPDLESSMALQMKELRQEEIICNLTEDKSKLQYKVKLLKQCLKRRDAKIKRLKCALKMLNAKYGKFLKEEL